MSFKPGSLKPKAPPPPEERHKATVRFTKRQWKQLRHILADKDMTLQSLIIRALSDTLPEFDS